ncbi:MAG: hypothetical protein HY823_13315 [Acidobacteria bacterium]|nr:hypothetical protein [Acidobacteriota bacterium]
MKRTRLALLLLPLALHSQSGFQLPTPKPIAPPPMPAPGQPARAPAPAKAGEPASPAPGSYPKNCDRCEDYPKLMKELKEQEWLRSKFHEYSPWSSYQLSASDVEDLQRRVTRSFNEWLNTPAGGGGAGAPAMGTNPDDCTLVFFVKGPDGKTTIKPYDEKWMRDHYCPTVLAFMKAHEASHQRTCRELGAKNKNFLTRPEFVAADEVKAYEAGIRVLEKAINDLAKRCHEEGTTATYKLDPNQKISPSTVYKTEEEARRIADLLERQQREADAQKNKNQGRK